MTPAPASRSTRQRAAIATLLETLDEFRSAQEMHDELRRRGENIGLTTVYRTLQSMAAAGMVDTLRTDTGESVYRRCSGHHHHHLVCRQLRLDDRGGRPRGRGVGGGGGRQAWLLRRQPHHRDLRHLRNAGPDADRRTPQPRNRRYCDVLSNFPALASISTSRRSRRQRATYLGARIQHQQDQGAQRVVGEPAAGKVVAQHHVAGLGLHPCPSCAARPSRSRTFSTSVTLPKLLSRACSATWSLIFLVSGRSQASIWVSDTRSRSSAMLTTRNDANVPSWRTVSAPSDSSRRSANRHVCSEASDSCQCARLAADRSLGAPEPSIAGGVFLARRPQVAAVVVGPQLVLEDVLGVRRLPQHEVAGPLLPRGPQEQVDVGDVGPLQVMGDRRLGDPVRVQPARGGLSARFPLRLRRFRCGHRS